MDRLKKARENINIIDKQMAELFCKRMEQVREVALYKQECGLPVFDETREAEVISRNSALVDNEEMRAYYINYLKSVMEISKNYQHKLLEGAHITYCGVEGAFANIAAKKIFPDGFMQPCVSFEEAYNSVVAGESDCAVLPIENSYAGEVAQVSDLMFEGSLFVNGIYDLQIIHHLLGTNESKLSDIKTVISHPQALSQCAQYIKKKNFSKVKAENTAMAAQMVADNGDKSIAAIASEETANLYDLKVLDHHINTSNTNTTRFAVFSRAENIDESSPKSNFILLFTVNNEAGALAKAISIIGRYGFNMKTIRSRPIKEVNWQYYFYVEAEGDISGENGDKMLSELSAYCDKVKVAGRYSSEIILTDSEE